MTPLPLILEPETLASQLGNPDLLIVDLSKPETYARGHIPGAINLSPSILLRGEGPVPNRCPTPEQLSERFSAIGLRPGTQVVLYDDELGPWAGRMIWTLDILGHQQASFLNGQLAGWIAAGQPLETSPNLPHPVAYTAQRDNRLIATLEDLLAHLDSSEWVIWDARSLEEYRGDKVINAQKGGHIPGARHLEWTDTLADLAVPRLKDRETLRRLLEEQGITPEKEVVTHCQTHRRSGLTYLVAKALGYPRLKCYDGSWFEWGNHPDTPVER